MKLGGALAIGAGAILLLSIGAQTSAAPDLRPVRTLVTTRAPIDSFAQDGAELAWVERPVGKRCKRVLHLRSLRNGHETTAKIGCGGYDDLALAGTRVLWNRLVGGGNLEQIVGVMTMGKHRGQPLELVEVEPNPVECYRLDRTCVPEHDPVLAGGAGVLAYATTSGVRRVVRGAHRPLSSFRAADVLTASGGRVLAVRSELRPGDGCGCASAPAWLPDGSIEYLSHVGLPAEQNGELTRIGGDGSGHQVLTNDRRFRQSLDVSADGKKVAYGYVAPPPDSRRLIGVAATDGSGAHDVGLGANPAWSPDGTKIAFDQGSADLSQIFVMNADGTNVTQLTFGAQSTRPSWSPDGTKIAYAVNGGISVMNADGSNPHALGLAGTAPDWSPDGSRLVFAGTFGIWVANADGSGAHLLAVGSATPQWSPDGSSIVFESLTPWWDVSSRSELYLIRPDGGDLRPLTFKVPAGWASPAEVRDGTGRLVSRFEIPGVVYDAALGSRVSALAEASGRAAASIVFFDTRTGARRGLVVLAARTIPDLVGISGRWLVYQAGRTISGMDMATAGANTPFFLLRRTPIGLSLSGNRVAWAENTAKGGRIRTLTLPK